MVLFMKLKHSNNFTLIELLVVIAIIAILMSLLLMPLQYAMEKAKYTRWMAYSKSFRDRTDLELYYNMNEDSDNNHPMPNLAYGDMARDGINMEERSGFLRGSITGPLMIEGAGRWRWKRTLYLKREVTGVPPNYVEATNYKGVDGSNDCTVIVWIKPESGAGGQPIVQWGPGHSLGLSNDLAPAYNGPGTGYGRLTYNHSPGFIKGNKEIISDGQWHCIAMTFKSDDTPTMGDVLLYVDGELDAQEGGSPAPTAFIDGPVTFRSGPRPNVWIGMWGVSIYSGYIDELAILHTALSAGEIRGFYEQGKP